MDHFNYDLTNDSTPEYSRGLDEPKRGNTAYSGYNVNMMSGANQQNRSLSGSASDIKLVLKGKTVVVQKPTTSDMPTIADPNAAGTSNSGGIKVLSATRINQNADLIGNKNAHKIQVAVTPKPKPPMMQTDKILLQTADKQGGKWFPAGIPRSFLKDSNYQGPAPVPMAVANMMYNYGTPGQFVPAFPPEAESHPPAGLGDDVSEDVGEASPDEDVGDTSPGRRSAFQRLGPVAPAKKPRLTINLLFSKEQSVREVVNEEPPQPAVHIPVPDREDILSSTNETVLKYLACWPWRNNPKERRKAIYRASKSAMMMEKREMMKVYSLIKQFFKIIVSGYPPHFTKEDVLDMVLESIKGLFMIPCFIEFTPKECFFLVLRSQAALEALHNNNLCVKKDDIELYISIVHLDLSLNHIDFIPPLILRKLVKDRCRENELDLRGFCLEYDVSHLLYYPLNRACNQAELLKSHTPVDCYALTALDLSGNRLTSIDGFSLAAFTPNLKKLNLSNNLLERVTLLLNCRNLPLQSLSLEHNPLCLDFRDPDYYVRVLRMMFPTLKEIDGTRIVRGGELPPTVQNYCPEEAAAVVERFLEVYFPLLDSGDARKSMVDLYDANAVFSLTYDYKIRFTPTFRLFREMFSKARIVEEQILDCVEGNAAIARHFAKWPLLLHDPTTFSVDVLHHAGDKTVFNVHGLVKLMCELAPEERHILKFTRSVVLRAQSDVHYRICNEMLALQEAKCDREIENAFNADVLASKRIDSKLQTPISQEIKDKLIEVFGKITNCKPNEGESCLASKDWDLRSALEYFVDLVSNDSLHTLKQDTQRNKGSL